MAAQRVFLLSPARIGGARSNMLFRPGAEFDLALRLQSGIATIGEVYAFISGLYFRGKLAYANAFAAPPPGISHAMVIVPGLGLLPPEAAVTVDVLRAIGTVDAAEDNDAFCRPLLRDASALRSAASPDCQVVLLGSIATPKYTTPLQSVFDSRLYFPAEFVGRGDMSRGGLMLRRSQSGEELEYISLHGAIRRGPRPPKLERLL